MIEPTRKTIADILKLPHRLKVPSYQRDFRWGTDEARELISDLKAAAEAPDLQTLFLGNIIVSRQGRDKELAIVDGQQRLTTISLLLLACRTLARKLDQHQAEAIQRMVTFIEDTSGYSYGPRLIVSPSIQLLYDHITSSRWDGMFPEQLELKGVKRQVNRVKPIYDFFSNEVREFDFEELKSFLSAVYGSYVVYIEISRSEEAFEIFERTNARGIELDAADLLKNFLFQQKHLSNSTLELEERWANIVENAGGTILRMLKYFWVSRKGYIQKKKLYPSLRDRGKKIGIGKLVDELLDFSEYYAAVRSGDLEDIKMLLRERSFTCLVGSVRYLEVLRDVFQSLTLFKVTQAYPLIYSIFTCYDNVGGKDDKKLTKKLLEILKTIEKYHFINNVICERVGNEVEHLYADYSEKFFSSRKFENVVGDLVIELRQRLAGPDEFIPRFSELAYSSADIPLVCYIFDRLNNHGLREGQSLRLFYPDRDIIKRNFDIEHFFPQKPSLADRLPHIGEAVHSVGNLLVISKFTNRNELKNLSPRDKVIKLKSSFEQIQNLVHIRDFLEMYHPEKQWNESTIKKRALDLANEAYSVVWSIQEGK